MAGPERPVEGSQLVVDVGALRDLIAREQERFGVPGLAVVVVADGEVVLSEGFGVRDVAAGEPVTADTHFPIASDSKAFTAALLCQLADEGRLDLDAPVRDALPWFSMRDPHATALVSTRDLLSHRTGLPRHDFVWYGHADMTNELAARALAHLEPNKQLRQTWQYNNLCYLTAGHVTEALLGTTWDDALRTRLLEPLGMRATVLSPWDPSVKELAQPYKDVKGEKVLQVIPRNKATGPAGGVVATATDMAQWLLARLGRRTDVLGEGALAQLHAPAMLGGVGGLPSEERQPMGYALGCQVESYRGHRLVRHGGNLVGFSSDVSVLPSAGIGVVVMTNLHATALRDALPLMVMDQLLGLEPVPWGERFHALMSASLQGRDDVLAHRAASAGGAPSGRPLEEYVGTYVHPAYGAFQVLLEGERLVPRFHELGDLLRLEHRHHEAFALFAVEFDTSLGLRFTQDSEGRVDGLEAALEPMVAPIRFERQAPEPEEGLVEAVVGSYALGPLTLVLRMRGDDLVATVPSAGTQRLVPAGGTRFTAPDMPALAVEARRAEDGSVTELVVSPVGVFARQP